MKTHIIQKHKIKTLNICDYLKKRISDYQIQLLTKNIQI